MADKLEEGTTVVMVLRSFTTLFRVSFLTFLIDHSYQLLCCNAARGSFDVATVLCAGDFRHLHNSEHSSATVVVPFEAALANTVDKLSRLNKSPKL